MTAQELATLTRRVNELEDKQSILETLYRYAHAHYAGPIEKYLDCFTEDAVINHSRRGDIAVGHAGLAALWRSIPSAPEAFHKNVVVEPIIEIDGDTATVAADYVYIQLDAAGRPYISNFGHYDDVLVRSADGRWRFTGRRFTSEVAPPS